MVLKAVFVFFCFVLFCFFAPNLQISCSLDIRFCSNFTSMWYKHFLKNVWGDFRVPMSALVTLAGKRLNCNFTAKIDFPIGYFMLPLLMLTFESLKSLHMIIWTKGLSFIQKGLSFINENQFYTVNTCFLCEILKILIGNMLNSMKESPSFYSFLIVVYHILSETEIWPFLRLLRMNSSEMQYRDQLNWTKELNRLLL